MDTEKKTFWISVIAGVIVMLAFALVFINVLKFVPFIGPFVGGLAAGFIRRGLLSGGKAGLVSGVIGGLVVSLDYLLGTGYLQGATLPVVIPIGSSFVIMSIIYFAFLAFIGGAISGWARR